MLIINYSFNFELYCDIIYIVIGWYFVLIVGYNNLNGVTKG